MSSKIQLVKGDTRPIIVASCTDEKTKAPIDLTGATAKLLFRATNSTTLKDTLTGTLLAGIEKSDGSISYTSPYDVAGSGGRVQFPMNANTLDTAGNFEGEIELTFADGGKQTVYKKLQFVVRGDFG